MMSYEERYRQYLDSLKVGDAVYPCYDGKAGRATPCVVVGREGATVVVEGFFWGEKDIKATGHFVDGEAWIKYDSSPTMMEMLGVNDEGEEGDYYGLIPPASLKRYCAQDYLQGLGLSDENY